MPSLSHCCTSFVNRLSDVRWESRLGVRTTRNAPSPYPDANRYGYLAYHSYFAALDLLKLGPSDVVVDLGCGKGRVVCAAAQYPIREAIGVEIDPLLAAMARHNVEQLRRQRAPARVVCESAVDFDFSTTTAIVMFHPFGADTMNQVLDRLAASLVENPRPLRIVYANPELSTVLTARPWLALEAKWTPGRWNRVKFPVHFYRSTGPRPSVR